MTLSIKTLIITTLSIATYWFSGDTHQNILFIVMLSGIILSAIMLRGVVPFVTDENFYNSF
jgi:hypothetical protein